MKVKALKKARSKSKKAKKNSKKASSSLQRNIKRPAKLRKPSQLKSWLDTPHHQQFWVNDGSILNNLKQLPDALQNMDKSTFLHHVNEHKNDFANWVEHVYQENELANKLRSLKSNKGMAKAIKAVLK